MSTKILVKYLLASLLGPLGTAALVSIFSAAALADGCPEALKRVLISNVEPPTVLLQARSIVSRQEALIDRLYPTTGFLGREQYLSAVKKANDPTMNFLVEMLQKEDVEIVIHRASRNRQRILESGFKNQHEVLTSRGHLDIDDRNLAEAGLLGEALENYGARPSALKPKSAYLRPNAASKLSQESAVGSTDWYGDDGWILDIDKIRDRITWTPTDSFNRFKANTDIIGKGNPAPLRAPNAWDQIFLPWRDRELLAPYLHPGALRRPLQDTTKAGDFGVWLESVSTGYHPPVSLKRSWRDDGSAYVEVQLWGAGDPLDIVKAFEYRMEEPDPKFLSELKRRGIKVYDRRNFRTSNGDYLKESGAFKDLPKN